jgi:photosystem II stability/assembly factor-like uncharacterized protein
MKNKIWLAFLMVAIVTLVSAMQDTFSSDQALEYAPSSPTKDSSFTANPITTNDAEPAATNIILQSKDGGLTWQDISQGLPKNEEPEDFFASESDLYLRVNDVMYRSESNLNTPVWEKENGLDQKSNSIAFNRSGVMAYNYDGQVYQKMSATGNWLPIYTNFKRHLMQTIFETTDGTVFIGSDHGLYKSTDKGRNWRLVKNEGWVTDIVESEGVLIGTGQNGIMRSTDNGEHWESVISEGGVGIAVERIEDGFASISYNTKTQSRRIRISLDNGKTWKAIDEGLPVSSSISSIKQLGKYLFCGHRDGIFRSSDMGKTWDIVHPSFDNMIKITFFNAMNNERVFKLYVSRNVLYAVARNSGC